MALPWSDWQFYVVTSVALAGLVLLLRPLLPARRGGACRGCRSVRPEEQRRS